MANRWRFHRPIRSSVSGVTNLGCSLRGGVPSPSAIARQRPLVTSANNNYDGSMLLGAAYDQDAIRFSEKSHPDIAIDFNTCRHHLQATVIHDFSKTFPLASAQDGLPLARLPGRYNREERLPTARPVLSLVACEENSFRRAVASSITSEVR